MIETYTIWHIGDGASSPTYQTLTAAYATGTIPVSLAVTQDISDFDKVMVGIFYKPKAAEVNRIIFYKLEISPDLGNTWTCVRRGVDTAPAGGEIVTETQDWVIKKTGAVGGTVYFDYFTLTVGFRSVPHQVLARISVKEDGVGNFGEVRAYLMASK